MRKNNQALSKPFRKISLTFVILLGVITIIGSGGGGGSDNGNNNVVNSVPTITSFAPTGGQAGYTVTITGTNFSTTPANNTVKFNGTAAVVTSSTSTQIVTTVPAGATNGPITVAANGNSATSSDAFMLLSFAGYYNDGTKDIPCYWTRTKRTDLAGDGINSAYAFSLAASSGGTVYVVGYYYDGAKEMEIPCYWAGTETGTTRTDLAGDDTNNAVAFSIAVSGSTVYIAGIYYDGTKAIPCYWTVTGTGTARTDLDGGANDAIAFSIAVSGSMVYTVGAYYDGAKDIPCCWIATGSDITRTDLGVGVDEAIANSIAVSGDTAYIAGIYYDGTKDIPCYWTVAGNAVTRIDLGDGAHSAVADSIAVSGGEVYTAGFYVDGANAFPCYWTGTSRTIVANYDAYVVSLAVSEGTVYTAGSYYIPAKDISMPCYWTGTTSTNLGDGINDAEVISAFTWW
jgi:hypothetical protein